MTNFYILPSRQALGQQFSETLTTLFPGSKFTHWDWPDLAETLAALVEGQGNACIVYREELDETIGLRQALVRDFGAEAADEIIEVRCDTGTPLLAFKRGKDDPPRKAA